MVMANSPSPRHRQGVSTPAAQQVKLLEETECGIPPFAKRVAQSGTSPLRPAEIEVLQINTGYTCNLLCRHCHVDAGPDRREMMTRSTMVHCLEALKGSSITTVDITGGAPEMNPEFRWFIEQIRACLPEGKLLVRSNLTLFTSGESCLTLPEFLREQRVNIIASLPCYTRETVDKIRGTGVFDRSIAALKLLNTLGYGIEKSGLELNLVYNPSGHTLPGDQAALEEEYRKHLADKFGIVFSHLFTITNMPVSRFLNDLLESGEYCRYMTLLEKSYNPLAVEKMMCRTTVSVGWDGTLYDCDFNQMLHLPTRKPAPQHISEFSETRLRNRTITLGQHCYGCSAGAGSSCQGSLV
ncbi:arsenosugar biosynthesis radical SAM (seleno)protein ArsS [Chlorobium sp. KB01]|uniref:arsenosugar biosynthesis radical SAM (seleno)protein ArsS n=1 Tax=Chlorobium sp. KB01 TaxID=1917528 RepID=UPI0009F86A39|nr:arsenosugar biosynthesis radical SAM (seleno)protein ArsS [Chlorobium sp. KB01]